MTNTPPEHDAELRAIRALQPDAPTFDDATEARIYQRVARSQSSRLRSELSPGDTASHVLGSAADSPIPPARGPRRSRSRHAYSRWPVSISAAAVAAAIIVVAVALVSNTGGHRTPSPLGDRTNTVQQSSSGESTAPLSTPVSSPNTSTSVHLGSSSPGLPISEGIQRVSYGETASVAGNHVFLDITITKPKLISGRDKNGAHTKPHTYRVQISLRCTGGSIGIHVDPEFVAHSDQGDSYTGDGSIQGGLPEQTIGDGEAARGYVQYIATEGAISSVTFTDPLTHKTLATWS